MNQFHNPPKGQLAHLQKKPFRPHPPLLLAGLVLFCSALALLSWSGSLAATENCTTLLTGRCERCHYLTRVCDKVAGNKGKWSWKRTVRNMVRLGAKLDEPEQDILVDCLSQPSPEVVNICEQEK